MIQGSFSSTLVLLIVSALGVAPLTQENARPQGHGDGTPATTPGCSMDLSKAGIMRDILSNALQRGLKQASPEVDGFLNAEVKVADDGEDLLKAAAAHFKIPVAELRLAVEDYRHCNCDHEGGEKYGIQGGSLPSELADITPFARNVTTHVVLHELAHALVREFDLPVLANEETLADAFATHYLATYLPDRAFEVLDARVKSLMVEAGEVPRAEWDVSGEHNSDARRAHQIAALAVARDPLKYRPIAESIGMSDDDIRSAADYGTEIHRSWRRLLVPLWMPHGLESTEARLRFESDSAFFRQLEKTPFAQELHQALHGFDWHSSVTIRFQDGNGGAGWNRSKRTITVNSAYVARFIAQGELIARSGARPKGPVK